MATDRTEFDAQRAKAWKMEVDAEFADSTNGAYFKNDRTATVVITERNFDASKVKITLKKDGQDYSIYPLARDIVSCGRAFSYRSGSRTT